MREEAGEQKQSIHVFIHILRLGIWAGVQKSNEIISTLALYPQDTSRAEYSGEGKSPLRPTHMDGNYLKNPILENIPDKYPK